MTAVEKRAVAALAKMPDFDDCGGSSPFGADNADAAIDWIESAGLAIVDAEVYRACVEAVRARVWQDEAARAALRAKSSPLYPALTDEWQRGTYAAIAAHDRAVKALENSGE